MSVTRRTFVTVLGAAPFTTMLPRAAFAAYPDRPVQLIVPFAAGGNADTVGRIVGDAMGKILGQTFVVENRGGAGGGIGAEYVSHATPDGYTLLVGSNGPLTVNPFVHANLGYDPQKDLTAVALTSYVPHVIILTNKVETRSISDLIALSKHRPVTIATSGIGSATHMTLERFKHTTGANITHVPYRGGGSLMPDVIGGNVDGAMTEFSTALPLHKSGKAHIVAIAAAKRSNLAPDIGTFDQGGVKGFTAQSFIGIVAPSKTPAEIIAQLEKAVQNGMAEGTPSAERLVGLGSDLAAPEQMCAKGFAAFIHADYEAMREAAKLAGIVPS